MKQPVVKTVFDFIASRLPFDKLDVRHMITEKEVPVHRMSWGYYVGGLALFFFIIQVFTGLMLLFYYEPTVSEAHESVEYITHFVTMGGLVRNLHAWSASFMIFCVITHMLTALAMKAFAKPRELTWIAGVLLLLITFGFGFTGYLLPWNQIAVNATKVGLASIDQIGQYLPAALIFLPSWFVKGIIPKYFDLKRADTNSLTSSLLCTAFSHNNTHIGDKETSCERK